MFSITHEENTHFQMIFTIFPLTEKTSLGPTWLSELLSLFSCVPFFLFFQYNVSSDESMKLTGSLLTLVNLKAGDRLVVPGY